MGLKTFFSYAYYNFSLNCNSKNPKLNKNIEKSPDIVYDIFEQTYTKEGDYQKN